MKLTHLSTNDAAEKGRPLTLRDPRTGADIVELDEFKIPQPVRLVLLGSDSASYRAKEHEIAMRRARTRGAAETFSLSREELENDVVETLAVCVVSWERIDDDATGKPLECTPENVRKLLRSSSVVREQVTEFVTKRSNFLNS